MLPDGTAARQDRLTMDFDLSPNAFQGRSLARGLFPIRTVDAEVASHEHGPVDEGHTQGKDVILRRTVLHAPIPRCVVADHAADATQVLTPGIGSEPNASLRQIRIQFGQENPGLDRNAWPHRVESDDPVEARRVQDDTGTDGRPGERSPRGAWGERDLEVATDPQDVE